MLVALPGVDRRQLRWNAVLRGGLAERKEAVSTESAELDDAARAENADQPEGEGDVLDPGIRIDDTGRPPEDGRGHAIGEVEVQHSAGHPNRCNSNA